jgi:hypothetical protein
MLISYPKTYANELQQQQQQQQQQQKAELRSHGKE